MSQLRVDEMEYADKRWEEEMEKEVGVDVTRVLMQDGSGREKGAGGVEAKKEMKAWVTVSLIYGFRVSTWRRRQDNG